MIDQRNHFENNFDSWHLTQFMLSKLFNCLNVHGLKSPLKIIKAFPNIISDKFNNKLPPEVKRLASIIAEKTGQAKKKVVSGLLSLFKINSPTLRVSEIDMNVLVKDAMQDLLYQPARQIIQILKRLHRIQGLKTLIKQLLFSLLNNVMKFSVYKKHAIISPGFGSLENEYVINIKDNGIGLNMKYEENIFNPFFRLRQNTDFIGNGLGLIIIKQ